MKTETNTSLVHPMGEGGLEKTGGNRPRNAATPIRAQLPRRPPISRARHRGKALSQGKSFVTKRSQAVSRSSRRVLNAGKSPPQLLEAYPGAGKRPRNDVMLTRAWKSDYAAAGGGFPRSGKRYGRWERDFRVVDGITRCRNGVSGAWVRVTPCGNGISAFLVPFPHLGMRLGAAVYALRRAGTGFHAADGITHSGRGFLNAGGATRSDTVPLGGTKKTHDVAIGVENDEPLIRSWDWGKKSASVQRQL